jgi:putative transcriptional regulator
MEKNQVYNSVSVIRKKFGLSQEELAQRVGVSRQTIISLEKGNYTPSVFLALKITACFGVGVDELFSLQPR